jgi:hypothetical protein
MERQALLLEIDTKIRKLQELRKIAADPDMFSLFNELNSLNGSLSANGKSNTTSKQKAKKKGRFVDTVEEACRSVFAGDFTIRDAIRAYEGLGHGFIAKNKSVAMYSALRRLVKKGSLQVAAQGTGRTAATYRFVERASG